MDCFTCFAVREAEQSLDEICDSCYEKEKNMVVIYGKTQCSSCEQAKAVLKSRGIPFEYKQLDKDYTMEELMDKLDELGMLGFRTFPLIVQGGIGYTFATINEVI